MLPASSLLDGSSCSAQAAVVKSKVPGDGEKDNQGRSKTGRDGMRVRFAEETMGGEMNSGQGCALNNLERALLMQGDAC